MKDLRIEPPELSIAIYSERDEAETFARLHEVALGSECSAAGPLEIAERNLGLLHG